MDTELMLGLLRVFVVLAVLAPLVYYVTRWYAGRQGRTSGQAVLVKETIPLGPNRMLCVVEWGSRQYLLGVTNQNISVLDQTIVEEPTHIGEEEL